GSGPIGIETDYDPAIIRVLKQELGSSQLADIGPVIDGMRMVKDAQDIATLRICGQIADAMMAACREALREGVPEYEVSLAAVRAGTLAAAGHLVDHGARRLETPMIRGLQVL